MHFDEVLYKIKLIADDLCDNHLEPFSKSVDEITNISSSAIRPGDCNRGWLKNAFDALEPDLCESIYGGKQVAEYQLQILQKKREDVNMLKAELDKLNSEYKSEKKNVEKTQISCTVYKEKAKGVENIKECIRVFKALTGTHFAYKQNYTTGYIQTEDPTIFEVFDFDHSNLSQEQILHKMWKLMYQLANKKSQTQS